MLTLGEESNGGYSAQLIGASELHHRGRKQQASQSNIREAIEGCVEAFPELNQLRRKGAGGYNCLKSFHLDLGAE